MNNNNYNKYLLNPFTFAFLLIFTKWLISYYFFFGSFETKIIYETSDNLYFPLIKSFSTFSFNTSYSNEINDLKLISYPILGLLVNTVFFKVFGIYSFFILEILGVYLFLFIFIKIFNLMNFSYILSFFFALTLFVLPQLLIDLSIFNFQILNKVGLNFQTFYSLRFPRPLINNLFFFGFLFFLLKFYLSQNNNTKYILYCTFLMCISMHSFFYFLIFELFLITLIYIIKFNKNILTFLKENLATHIYLSILFILFYLLFLLQGQYDEPDYAARLGLIEINDLQHKILLKYFLNFFSRIEFIFIFLLNSVCFIYSKKKSLSFFYYLFISTLLSTTFFILTFDRGIDYYHFTNWILVSGLLFPLFFLFDYFANKMKNINFKFLGFPIIILAIFYYGYSVNFNNHFLSHNNSNEKKQLVELIEFFKSNNNLISKNSKILTFNYNASLFLILNNFNNFNIVPVSFWTPKKTYDIENELISSVKFLNFTKIDFLKFIENKKRSWRYKNKYIENFFDRIYLANQLKTFNNQMDYTNEEIELIKKNSPLITHQLIIPQSEFERFSNKFDKIKKIDKPDIILLDYSNEIFKNYIVDENTYCTAFKNESFVMYVDKDSYDICN